MYTLAKVIHCLFPLIALILLIIGIKRKAIQFVISSLWLSLISLSIHYQSSGGELLGSYFNILNAAIYSFNLIVLVTCLIQIISHLSTKRKIVKYITSFIQSFLVLCSFLVITNLWINAYFIENRMPGTPVMQVALFKKVNYCNYKYIFYNVAKDGAVTYLCPNYYGLIPSIGRLDISPDFIATQLSIPIKKQMLLIQEKKN